jgi:hypothetical protein
MARSKSEYENGSSVTLADQFELACIAQNHILIATYDHMKAAYLHFVLQFSIRGEPTHRGNLPTDNSTISRCLRVEDLTNPGLST